MKFSQPSTSILIQAYSALQSTVDRIATSSELRHQIRTLLPPEFERLDDDQLIRQLLNLRKCGRLPKHFRGV